MRETCVGFVDIGFLRAAGAGVLQQRPASVNPNAAAVVNWFRELVEDQLGGHTFLRAYWYDGAFDPSHRDYARQRVFLDAVARTPGIQLRLGHIAEYQNPLEAPILRALENTANDLGLEPVQVVSAFNRRWRFRPVRQQKGVDTLITLDMVRLAGRSAYTTAVLIAGDRDLAEAIRTVQDFGARVLIATPSRRGVAEEVEQLSDGIVDIGADDLRLMLPPRPARTN